MYEIWIALKATRSWSTLYEAKPGEYSSPARFNDRRAVHVSFEHNFRRSAADARRDNIARPEITRAIVLKQSFSVRRVRPQLCGPVKAAPVVPVGRKRKGSGMASMVINFTGFRRFWEFWKSWGMKSVDAADFFEWCGIF